ncbi:MAG TPA: phosphatase PAP2 family protein [Gaiellaceae bacterium]|nr:phosphatase PAP2 family protein [Gaiellaceae bacterium]
MTFEHHFVHWVVSHRVGGLDQISIALSWIGTLGLVWLAIALAVALVWRRPSVFLITVLADALADLAAEVGKVLVDRHRPFEHQLGPPSARHSFPSGHTSTSFACATVLALYVPRLRVPFFVLATLIGLSRIYNAMHYPSDVLAGAILGTFVAIGVVRGWRAATARLPREAALRRSRQAPPPG